MLRQTLTQTDGSPQLRGGGLAGDIRNGCWECTCVRGTIRKRERLLEQGSHGLSLPPALGQVFEADFLWPLREAYVMCGFRETPGEWLQRRFHQKPLFHHLVSRRGGGPRSSGIISFRKHEHSDSLCPTQRQGILTPCLLVYSPDNRACGVSAKNLKFCWSVTHCTK